MTSGRNVSHNDFTRRGFRAGTVDRSTRPWIALLEAGGVSERGLGWGKAFSCSGPQFFLICKIGGWGWVTLSACVAPASQELGGPVALLKSSGRRRWWTSLACSPEAAGEP